MAQHLLKRMRPKKVSMSRSRSALATAEGVAASPTGICCRADSLRAGERCGAVWGRAGQEGSREEGGNGANDSSKLGASESRGEWSWRPEH